MAVIHQTYKVKWFVGENEVCYTLSLHSTINSMLMNGNDIGQFMDFHLPVLHELRKVWNERQPHNQTANNVTQSTASSQSATDNCQLNPGSNVNMKSAY